MQYIVTFEEKMLVDNQYTWVKGHRIYETLKEVRDFLEVMYACNGDVFFGNAQVWHVDEPLSYHTTFNVNFDKE